MYKDLWLTSVIPVLKGSSRTKVGGVPPETFIAVLIHKDDGVAEFSVYQRSNDRTACFLWINHIVQVKMDQLNWKKYRVRHLRSKSKRVKFSEKLIIQAKQWTSDLQCMRVLSMNAQCLTENNDHLHVKFSTSYRVAMFHSCKNVNKHLEPDFILISLAFCVKRQFIMRSVYPLNCAWCFNDDQGFDLLLNRIHFCPPKQ